MSRWWSLAALMMLALLSGGVVSAMNATDGDESVKRFHLYATDGVMTTADGQRRYIWGYSLENRPGSATFPAPILTVNEGDRVEVTLTNLGPSRSGVIQAPHTIHFHGLDTEQHHDGVPETGPIVRVGESFTYTFTATHAGTYWYHCHVDTIEHLTMGMYGAFVVRAADGASTAWTGGPEYDREYTLLMSEMDPTWHAAVAENRAYDRTRFHPRFFFINGKSFPDTMDDSTTHVVGRLGERILVRLINAGYQWRSMHMHGFHFDVVATDGRPLPYSYSKDTLSIGPGERYDILVTLDQLGSYPFHSHAILDNTNDGAYPGGIHTMVTVVAPGDALPDPTHGHEHGGHAGHGGHGVGPVHQDSLRSAAPSETAPPAPDSARAPVQTPAPAMGFWSLFGAFGAPQEVVGEPSESGDYIVVMEENLFHPERLVVPVGATVTWINRDPRPHDVAWDQTSSRDILTHRSFSYTFDKPGLYLYECTQHRGMTGAIRVTE